MLGIEKNGRKGSPGRCSTVVKVSAHAPKGYRFNFQPRVHTWVLSLALVEHVW